MQAALRAKLADVHRRSEAIAQCKTAEESAAWCTCDLPVDGWCSRDALGATNSDLEVGQPLIRAEIDIRWDFP